jgi:hypothetical protein
MYRTWRQKMITSPVFCTILVLRIIVTVIQAERYNQIYTLHVYLTRLLQAEAFCQALGSS